MKKILIAITLLSLFAVCTSLSTQAVTTENARGTISVNTSANTELAPDVAEISFAVQSAAKNSLNC